jgi:hypothetical protein
MAERIARLGYMHYRDADGRIRDAVAGETIQVHPDDVERFDSLNVLMGHKPDDVKAEPKAEPVTPVEETSRAVAGPARWSTSRDFLRQRR